MKSGPIILIEDDVDDKEILEEIIKELNIPNKLTWFKNCSEALHYLNTTTDHPFIILSDINLPKLTGIEFKRRIDEDPFLRKKSIPFIFYSTSADMHVVDEVYTTMTIQGFFEKSNSFEETKANIESIIEYWKACKHPNSF